MIFSAQWSGIRVRPQTSLGRPPHGGFTLVEMMIAVAVLAVIVAIAVPSYNSYITRAARAKAMAAMLDVMQKQERYYTNQGAYCTSTTTCPWLVGPSDLTKHTLSVSGTSPITLSATPVASDPQCGTLTITSAGVRGSSGSLSTTECWK